jgi:hypothetical protein
MPFKLTNNPSDKGMIVPGLKPSKEFEDATLLRIEPVTKEEMNLPVFYTGMVREV